MIYGISGKPGGGKSYEAVVTHIIPIVTQDKRKVVTNLPLNIDKFCSVYGEFCRELIEVIDGQFHNYGGERPFSKVAHYTQYEDWQNEKGQKVYFFIDECHLPLPMQGTEKELTEFYSMHRHYGFDIMLITQNFRKVNRDIRDMVGNHYRAIKKSMLGQDHKYILKVHDGSSSSNASVFATHEREYEKKYFSFYQSHTKSDTSVDEASSNDIVVWYKQKRITFGVGILIFCIFILTSMFSSKDEVKDKKPVAAKLKAEKVDLPVNEEPVNTHSELAPEDIKKPKNRPQRKPVSPRVKEYEKIVDESSSYHPFYKVELSITGFYEGMDGNRLKRTHYFSAGQNGFHVFELETADLMMAGYEVQILGECVARIIYHDFEDFITCNRPKVNGSTPVEQIASLN